MKEGQTPPETKDIIVSLALHGLVANATIDLRAKDHPAGIDAPRRHKRMVRNSCVSLVEKLRSYRPDQVLMLLTLAGKANAQFAEHGNTGLVSVHEEMKKPILIEWDHRFEWSDEPRLRLEIMEMFRRAKAGFDAARPSYR